MSAENPQVKVGDRVRALAFTVPLFGADRRVGAVGTVEAVGTTEDLPDPDRLLWVRFDGGLRSVKRWELAAPEPEYVPEVGHNVRATHVREGVVAYITSGGAVFATGGIVLGLIGDESYNFERLPDPEPEVPSWWPPRLGDWIQSRAGSCFVYDGTEWRTADGDIFTRLPSRLDASLLSDTLIFRGGKPVGGAS